MPESLLPGDKTDDPAVSSHLYVVTYEIHKGIATSPSAGFARRPSIFNLRVCLRRLLRLRASTPGRNPCLRRRLNQVCCKTDGRECNTDRMDLTGDHACGSTRRNCPFCYPEMEHWHCNRIVTIPYYITLRAPRPQLGRWWQPTRPRGPLGPVRCNTIRQDTRGPGSLPHQKNVEITF